MLALVLAHGPAADAKTEKLVGVAANSCVQFNFQIAQDPAAERDFVEWTQGYMSGLVIWAPAGVDEDPHLLFQTYTLARQTEFLRAFCRDNPSGTSRTTAGHTSPAQKSTV